MNFYPNGLQSEEELFFSPSTFCEETRPFLLSLFVCLFEAGCVICKEMKVYRFNKNCCSVLIVHTGIAVCSECTLGLLQGELQLPVFLGGGQISDVKIAVCTVGISRCS